MLAIKLIVGLGNPGNEYRGTRHNAGADFVEELARECEVPLIVYPNAGLPNELGGYDEAPSMTAGLIREWADEGWVNIVGGCCGTTPGHIEAIAKAVESDKSLAPARTLWGKMLLSAGDPSASHRGTREERS